jgi:hypothetical protein
MNQSNWYLLTKVASIDVCRGVHIVGHQSRVVLEGVTFSSKENGAHVVFVNDTMAQAVSRVWRSWRSWLSRF